MFRRFRIGRVIKNGTAWIGLLLMLASFVWLVSMPVTERAPSMASSATRRSVGAVVLDAGHGGFDQGATSILGNEKDFTLDVVERARDLLLKAGFNVRLTRSADVFVTLEDRAGTH